MSEINNNADVKNSESSDGSSIQFINRKCGSRKLLLISSDSSDCSSTNISTNILIGRKISSNPDNWAQIHKSIKKQKVRHTRKEEVIYTYKNIYRYYMQMPSKVHKRTNSFRRERSCHEGIL